MSDDDQNEFSAGIGTGTAYQDAQLAARGHKPLSVPAIPPADLNDPQSVGQAEGRRYQQRLLSPLDAQAATRDDAAKKGFRA
jgi:hypothetical protein